MAARPPDPTLLPEWLFGAIAARNTEPRCYMTMRTRTFSAGGRCKLALLLTAGMTGVPALADIQTWGGENTHWWDDLSWDGGRFEARSGGTRAIARKGSCGSVGSLSRPGDRAYQRVRINPWVCTSGVSVVCDRDAAKLSGGSQR